MRTKEQDAAELERFKRADITKGLEAFGYTKTAAHVDAKSGKAQSESWKRDGTALKAFKAKSGDQMWTCTSGASPSERGGRSGTIIHIASFYEGGLGRARIRLREIYGDITSTSSPAPSPSHSPSLSASRKSFWDIARELRQEATIWDPTQPVPVYLRERGLDTIDPIFARSFWVAKKAHAGSPNVIFPYHTCDEMGEWKVGCYEKKNRGFKGVCAGAPSSGFWKCVTTSGRASWYIAENPINAMSYHKLNSEGGALDGVNYAGLRSGGDRILAEYLSSLCHRGDAPLELVFLADNDPRGWKYAVDVCKALSKEIEAHSIVVRMELAPDCHNDWNDYLMSQASAAPEPEPEVFCLDEDLAAFA